MKAYCKTIIAIYVIYLAWLYCVMHEDDIKKGVKKAKRNWKNFKLRFEKVNYEVVK